MPWSIFSEGGGPGAAVTWAEDFLKALGVPVTEGNKQFVYDWEKSEGGGGKYNPLNQGTVSGQPQLTSTGSQYGGGAADYVSWDAGIQGAVAYLNYPNYSKVRLALLANDPQAARAALIQSPWASSHYGGGSGFSSEPLPGQATALPGDTGGGSGGGGGGGGSDPVGNTVTSILGALSLPVQWATDLLNGPSDVAKALIGASAPFIKIAEGLDWLFHPNHWIRIFAGLGGAVLVGAGLYNMSHVTGVNIPTPAGQVGVSTPASAALPIGILEVGAGAVLLFVAFHNLPDSVATFPGFVTYLTTSLTQGSGVAAQSASQ